MSPAILLTIVLAVSSEVGTTAVVGRPLAAFESLPTKNLAEALELLESESILNESVNQLPEY